MSEAKRILEDIDRSFNENSVFVEVIPMFGISGDTGTVSEILIGIGVNASAVRGIGAGIFTSANPSAALWNGFRANPLKAERTVFTAAFPETGKLFFCQRANGITELIEFCGR